MAFILEEKELNKFEKLNILHDHLGGKIFIEDENTLIKVTNKYIYEMLQYLESIPEHENVVNILEAGKVINSKTEPQSCYRMKYLGGAKTFLELYRDDIPYEKKLKYIKEIFDALKFLHQYIVLGDIHSKNILVHNNKAYLNDLDNSRKLNERWKPIFCGYNLSILRIFENTKYTDITKLYIESLAFILGFNFSKAIFELGYAEFYKVIMSYHLPKEVEEFLKMSCSSNKMKKLGDEAYNVEKFLTPDILGLKKSLGFFKVY